MVICHALTGSADVEDWCVQLSLSPSPPSLSSSFESREVESREGLHLLGPIFLLEEDLRAHYAGFLFVLRIKVGAAHGSR